MNDKEVHALWKVVEELAGKVAKLEAYVSARREDIARFNKYRLLRP